MRRKITTEKEINNQPVRADQGYLVIENIICGMQAQLEYMKRYKQVLYSSCVVKYPENSKPVKPTGDISAVMRKVHQRAHREQIEIATVWTMEQKSSETPHFNVIFWANGKKTKSGFRTHKWLKEIWARHVGVDVAHSPVHLNKNDPKFFPPAAEIGVKPAHQIRIRVGTDNEKIMSDNAINAASYDAKIHTKENLSGRTYGLSRIPKK